MREWWPLIGRAPELLVAEEQLRERSGVVLAGNPGVGKTRLAAEISRRDARRGGHVERLVATENASRFAFGALAHLVPEEDLRSQSVAGAVAARLRQRAQGRPIVLHVDDAHLLDDASAALVHHLVTSQVAPAVLTVQARRRAPDAIVALWKDQHCGRIELAPLSRPEVDLLVERALGGQVEGRARELLWAMSRGNVLFLRELVASGCDGGWLRRERGIWRLTGPPTPASRLVELVELRLGRVDADERDALELLALSEPLELTTAFTLAAEGTIERLEDRGLVEVFGQPTPTLLRFAHPVYGEVVRTQIAPLRARRLCLRLAEVAARREASTVEDLVRAARLRLVPMSGADGPLLLHAARRVRTGEGDVAERLARAAMETGDPAAVRLLADILCDQGRVDEAYELLSGALDDVEHGPDRIATAVSLADTVGWRLVRPAEALRILEDAASGDAPGDGGSDGVRSAEPSDHTDLEAARALFTLFLGHAERAATQSVELVHAGGNHPLSVLIAVLASHAFAGRFAAVERLVNEADEVLDRFRIEDPARGAQLQAAVVLGRIFAGDLDDARRRSTDAYERGLAQPHPAQRAVGAFGMGVSALVAGSPRVAWRWLREASPDIAAVHIGLVRWSRYLSVMALASGTGRHADGLREAARVIEDDDADDTFWFGLFESERLRALARLATAQGDSAGAAQLLTEATVAASASGAAALEALARADLAALGGADGTPSRRPDLGASAVDAGPTGPSPGFVATRPNGPVVAVGALTERELEIAGLAAGGATDAEIARVLSLSVRTVHAHLHRAYAKLAIAGRHELDPAELRRR